MRRECGVTGLATGSMASATCISTPIRSSAGRSLHTLLRHATRTRPGYGVGMTEFALEA
jgi:hypothetical protein